MLNKTCAGIAAGIMISIGGSVFLNCENRYIGSLLFTIALIVICFKGYSLYTGRIGYILDKHSGEDVSVLLFGLLGNTLAAFACGLLLKEAIGSIGANAQTLCSAKLEQTVFSTFVRSVFCGIIVYIAVSIFKDENKSVVQILIGIPAFILSGFEHSIADMFYFAASGIYTARTALFIIVVLLGNSVGAIILPALERTGVKQKANAG